MKIDTEICHVTRPGANLFMESGFTPEEAKRLQAASRKQISNTWLLKPARIRRGEQKTAKFSIRTLVEMLSRAGQTGQACR